MKKDSIYIIVLFFIISIFCFSEESNSPYYSIGLSSGIEYPLNTDFDLLRLGMNVNIENELTIPRIPWLQARADICYSLLPVQAETSLSLIGLGIGPSFSFEITPRFLLGVSVLGGGVYGFFNNNLINSNGIAYENQQGGGAFFTAGGKLSFFLSPQLSLGLNMGYVNYIGLTQGLRGAIKVTLHLDGFKQKVQYKQIEFENIFPSQYKYYAVNPVGSVIFTNNERFPAKDVSLSVFVEQYMDNPTVTSGPENLRSGESYEIVPNILLSNTVLNLTEVSKVTAQLIIDYYINGRLRQKIFYQTLTLQNRNAITWDDDRKAAAFISPKNPDILRFSKRIAGLVREKGPKTVNLNLRMALGLFEALGTYGLSYVIDPNTLPYEDAARNMNIVDFLQYPTETLAYKGGDCDDLSILYCSLLESIGIESAFITVPGHIYSAFSLGMTPAEARKIFSGTEELIFTDDSTWIPIETTLISEGFYVAWRSGARQWQENREKDRSVLIPISHSWKTYEASGSPEIDLPIILPDMEKTLISYDGELTSFIDRELDPMVRSIQSRITQSPNPMSQRNRLGILYARYGRFDKAISEFRKILDSTEYFPALINLGNIYFLQDRYDEAFEIFSRAEAVDRNNPVVLLSLAKINYEFSNMALVNSYFTRATRLKPELSAQFSYLSSVSADSVVRAENVENSKNYVLWVDPEEE